MEHRDCGDGIVLSPPKMIIINLLFYSRYAARSSLQAPSVEDGYRL